MTYLGKIIIYPIKSLDGVEVTEIEITSGGSLKNDRRYALFDQDDRLINAKKYAQIQKIRSTYNLEENTITITTDYQPETFNLITDIPQLNQWFSDYLRFPVFLKENLTHGFPDDQQATGPTIISLATLQIICTWFPDLNIEEIRRRFRTNLELNDLAAFGEEQLIGTIDRPFKFQIGHVIFHGINPCQRCIVPTRNSYFGSSDRNFQKTFINQRQKTSPPWLKQYSSNPYYRLALNTIIPSNQTDKILHLNDKLKTLTSFI